LTLAATDLAAHQNGASAQGYWIGVGVLKKDNDKYAAGWGLPPDGSTISDAAQASLAAVTWNDNLDSTCDSETTLDGTKYATWYWGTENSTPIVSYSHRQGYIVVKRTENTAATDTYEHYLVKFSNVTTKDSDFINLNTATIKVTATNGITGTFTKSAAHEGTIKFTGTMPATNKISMDVSVLTSGDATAMSYAYGTGAPSLAAGKTIRDLNYTTVSTTNNVITFDISSATKGYLAIKYTGTKTTAQTSVAALENREQYVLYNLDFSGITKGTVSNPKVDSSGELSYNIESGKTATLEEVLTAFTSSGGTASQIKELPITSQITKVDNSTLKKLTLEELDLTSASGLTDTTLDLDGVTVDKVTMGKNTKVEKLELDSSSKVEEIDASGATNLEKIDLASNKNIETLNVSNSGVTNLDASGCTNLATLNTKGAKLTVLVLKNCTSLTDLDCSSGGELKELDLSTCTALKTLDVSGNKLLILDLSKLTSLTSSTLGNQTSTESFTLSRNLNLADFLKKALGVTESEALAYAKNITRVVDVATGEDAANYDEDDGTASFESTPKGSIRYYYNTKGTVSNAELADVLAGINDMDVTLTAGVAGEEEKSSGGSSSGCNLVMSEELGVRGVLLFLAAMFMFASMKMKIKRG